MSSVFGLTSEYSTCRQPFARFKVFSFHFLFPFTKSKNISAKSFKIRMTSCLIEIRFPFATQDMSAYIHLWLNYRKTNRLISKIVFCLIKISWLVLSGLLQSDSFVTWMWDIQSDIGQFVAAHIACGHINLVCFPSWRFSNGDHIEPIVANERNGEVHIVKFGIVCLVQSFLVDFEWALHTGPTGLCPWTAHSAVASRLNDHTGIIHDRKFAPKAVEPFACWFEFELIPMWRRWLCGTTPIIIGCFLGESLKSLKRPPQKLTPRQVKSWNDEIS